MTRPVRQRWFSIPLTLLLGGCALGGEGSPLAIPAAVSTGTSAVAEAAAAATKVLSGPQKPVGTPTEIYTRVARGILTCWFGSNGPLKPDYIYHADAEPPSKGGASTIDVRTRDTTSKDPRSLRAWRVVIEPKPEGTALLVENAKLPEHWAQRLETDVQRWAAAEEGCGETPVTDGWAANPASVETVAAKAGKKKKN
ncbi:MAG: hypothetical protein NW216_12620 [Hyphomicrobium sp.]|nr:hypothetical protein [Hyphomicrobium sp.]